MKKVFCNFIKKETLAQVFSCEFCEISKNIFSYRTTVGCFCLFFTEIIRNDFPLLRRPTHDEIPAITKNKFLFSFRIIFWSPKSRAMIIDCQ